MITEIEFLIPDVGIKFYKQFLSRICLEIIQIVVL